MINKKIYNVSLFIFLLSTIISCDQSNSRKIVHPDYSLLPSDEIIDYTVDLSVNSQNRLPALYHPDSLKKIGEIGIDSVFTDENYYYNSPPTKIDIDPMGNIYIIQSHTNSINVYDKQGNYLYKIGRNGKGPGEFTRINTFDFDHAYEKLYVLDFLKIEIFKMSENGRFEPEKTILLEDFSRTYDLCFLNNQLFISGFRIDPSQQDSLKELSSLQQQISALSKIKVSKPISRLNIKTSELELDFGFIYKSESGFGPYDGMLSETMLTCHENTNTVIANPKFDPFIFGYNTGGKIKWRAKVNNFTSTQTTERFTAKGPELVPYSNEDIFNRYYPFREIGSERYSLIQIGYFLPQKVFASSDTLTLPEPSHRTLLIDTNSGELLLSNLYDLFGVQKNNRVITINVDKKNFNYTFDLYEL